VSLDRDELRVLADIERELAADHRRLPTVFVLSVLFYIGAPLISLLFGGTALTLTTIGYAGWVTAVLVRRRWHAARRR
jgi:hypothetical protein